MELAHTLLSFLVAICALVAVHEFGHFWVARRLGVKVLRFSIGLGPPLRRWFGRDPDRVEYVIGAFPLGGYVKMLDETEGDVDDAERGRAFNRQSLAVRTAVVSAGPAFNFLFAIIAYAAMFLVGIDGLKPFVGSVDDASIAARAGLRAGEEVVAVDGKRTHTWQGVIEGMLAGSVGGAPVTLTVRSADGGQERAAVLDLRQVAVDDLTRGRLFEVVGFQPRRPLIPAVIGDLEGGGPAATAGLLPGDVVQAVDGAAVDGWHAFRDAVRASPGRVIRVEVERGGRILVIDVVPAPVAEADGEFGRIGAGVQRAEESLAEHYATERYGPLQALARGAEKTAEMSLLTVRFLWKMLRGEVSVKNLSGPISIAQYAGLSAQDGLGRFLDFLGIVSISLGILNLLPIPVLDGGHLLYYLIEFVRGRPLSDQAQYAGQRIGVVLLVGLMSLAFYNDLARLLE